MLFLAHLLRHFRVRLVSRGFPVPLAGITLRPRDDVPINLELR